MVTKLYLALSFVLGIGIGLVVPSVSAITSGGHGHGQISSGHGSPSHTIGDSGKARMQITRSATVETKYPPQKAIQLFTAEGEKYWLGAVGWNPTLLRGDGFNRNDVFAIGGNTFIAITFDAEEGIAEYARVEQGKTAGVIGIKVGPKGEGSVARVTYSMTGLSEEGDKALEALTDEAFAADMASWESAIAANDDTIEEWLASRN